MQKNYTKLIKYWYKIYKTDIRARKRKGKHKIKVHKLKKKGILILCNFTSMLKFWYKILSWKMLDTHFIYQYWVTCIENKK